MLRSFCSASALALTLAVGLCASPALALDGGADGGDLDAASDASPSIDASTDAPIEASTDASTDAPVDAWTPTDDSGPITFRPDADTPGDDDAGVAATPVESGCSMAPSGAGLPADSLALAFGLVGAALVVRRRGRRGGRAAG